MTNDLDSRQRLRVRFAKEEQLKYISHLDLARAWERIFRRARLPLAYSQGFNPRPRFQLAAALPVGVTGQVELMDIWLAEPLAVEDLLARLRRTLPPGLEVLAAEQVDLRLPSLQSQVRMADYRVVVHSEEPVEAIRTRIQALLAAPTLIRQRQHKGQWQSYDLRPLIHSVDVQVSEDHAFILTMHLEASPMGAGRPDEVLDALGLSLMSHTAERTNLIFEFDK
jgi:radical SAM-linked protein